MVLALGAGGELIGQEEGDGYGSAFVGEEVWAAIAAWEQCTE
jgi:hypothetical protein